MRDTLDKLLKSISEFFKKMSKRDKIRLTVILVVIFILGVVVAALLGRTTYAVLYSGTDMTAAGQIIAYLDETKEPYKAEGTTIYVSEKRVAQLKMSLASGGITSSLAPDTSYIDAGSGLNTTDEIQRAYSVKQTEADIRTGLNAFSKIDDCFVKLVPASTSVFVMSGNQTAASVSVTLVTRGELTQSEANAVFEKIKNSVGNLEYENISVDDQNLNIYIYNKDAEGGESLTERLALQRQVADNLERQILNLLAPIYGEAAVKAEVNVLLGFDDVITERIEFAPPVEGETEGMIVSASESFTASRSGTAAEGIPGTDSNGMGTTEYPYGDIEDGETLRTWTKEYNNELNRTTTQIKTAKGYITALSVAISIDSTALKEDFDSQVHDHVATLLGIDGGYVSVLRLPFGGTEKSLADLEKYKEELKRQELIGLIKQGAFWLAVILLALMLLLFIRSIVKITAKAARSGMAMAGGVPDGSVDYIAGEDTGDIIMSIAREQQQQQEEERRKAAELDLSKKLENVENIERLIDRDAGAVSQLLRNWLSDD